MYAAGCLSYVVCCVLFVVLLIGVVMFVVTCSFVCGLHVFCVCVLCLLSEVSALLGLLVSCCLRFVVWCLMAVV